jgi:hypothetical protein
MLRIASTRQKFLQTFRRDTPHGLREFPHENEAITLWTSFGNWGKMLSIDSIAVKET